MEVYRSSKKDLTYEEADCQLRALPLVTFSRPFSARAMITLTSVVAAVADTQGIANFRYRTTLSFEPCVVLEGERRMYRCYLRAACSDFLQDIRMEVNGIDECVVVLGCGETAPISLTQRSSDNHILWEFLHTIPLKASPFALCTLDVLVPVTADVHIKASATCILANLALSVPEWKIPYGSDSLVFDISSHTTAEPTAFEQDQLLLSRASDVLFCE